MLQVEGSHSQATPCRRSPCDAALLRDCPWAPSLDFAHSDQHALLWLPLTATECNAAGCTSSLLLTSRRSPQELCFMFLPSFLERAKLFLRKENLLSLEAFWGSSVGASVLELIRVPSGHDHLSLPLLLFDRFLCFTSVIPCAESSTDIFRWFILCVLVCHGDPATTCLWLACAEHIQVLASSCQMSVTECWSKEWRRKCLVCWIRVRGGVGGCGSTWCMGVVYGQNNRLYPLGSSKPGWEGNSFTVNLLFYSPFGPHCPKIALSETELKYSHLILSWLRPHLLTGGEGHL